MHHQVLEQDVKLICAQEDHVARTGQPLAQAFLPIKTSDTLVVELRKWLDHVGHGMPYFTGWNKRKVQLVRARVWEEGAAFRVMSTTTSRYLYRILRGLQQHALPVHVQLIAYLDLKEGVGTRYKIDRSHPERSEQSIRAISCRKRPLDPLYVLCMIQRRRQEPAHLSDHENSRLHDHRSNVSRYHRHVLISTETRRALAAVKRVKKVGLTLAAALATGSMLLVGPGAGMGTAAMSRIRATSLAALCGAVCSLSFGVAALVFEGHFYRNFERHPALE